MRLRPALATSAVLALLPAAALADPSGFAFLEVPAGARASALGGAFTSLAQGAEAAFWNPAGLEGVRGLQVTGAHYEFLGNLRHDQFAVAGRALGGGLAASVRALYSEPIEERDERGNLVGSFGAHDLELGLGYGRALGGGLRLGGSAQVVRERLANASATTYAFGVGGTWDPAALPGARLAASVHNVGPAAHYDVDGMDGRPVNLPAAVQAGVSYGLGMGRGLDLRGALEGRFTRGRSGVGMVGAEVSGLAGTALRMGFRVNDEATGFSAGAGWGFSSLRFDYAFVPFRLDLGDTHRFAFSAQF